MDGISILNLRILLVFGYTDSYIEFIRFMSMAGWEVIENQVFQSLQQEF